MIPWSRLEVARRGQGPAHAPVTGSPQMSGGGCSVGSRGGMALICVPVEDATVTRLSVGSQAAAPTVPLSETRKLGNYAVVSSKRVCMS